METQVEGLLRRLETLRDAFAEPPTAAFLTRLDEVAEFDPQWHTLASAAHSATTESLADEWMRLFEGPGRFPVVLFGSYYLDEEQLMGPSTLGVLDAYSRWGLEKSESTPADHLAYELGFLGFLSDRCETAESPEERERARRERDEFVTKYVANWVPAVAENMEAHSETAYFRELARFLRGEIAALAAS